MARKQPTKLKEQSVTLAPDTILSKVKRSYFKLAALALFLLAAYIFIWQVIIPNLNTGILSLKKAPDFPAGIYYRQPNETKPIAQLKSLNPAFKQTIELPPGSFDIRKDRLIYGDGSKIWLVNSKGDKKSQAVKNLYSISRPSFSPDGKKVAVQASETKDLPPKSLHVYILDLRNGKSQRIDNTRNNTISPKWFKRDDRIAYVSAGSEGSDIHVYDLAKRKELYTIKKAGGSHLAISPDGKYIASFGVKKIFSASDGKQVADLVDTLVAYLLKEGFKADNRFATFTNQGSFVLDGSFSPDGKYLVFDGAILQGASYGDIMYQINYKADEFKVLSPLLPTNPDFTANNNYSQLNPLWL